MRQTDVDLLVIGGGINGCGIARDAAGRGMSVLLVEQDDLAQHTSSASTKLVHGGLRYLEYFEFGLVRAALQERERLLAIAPHLVRPLEFVLPQTHSSRPAWMIKLGLALYDRLGGHISLPRSRRIRIQASRYGAELQPHVEHGFIYSDCWVDDSRLVILNALDAAECGAEIRTRTRFVHATRDEAGWRCTLLDRMTGEASTVSSRVLINAAGPWAAEVLANRVNVSRTKSARLVKGSHIVVPRLHDGAHALMLQNPDRRIVFVVPFEDRFSLIGTTELASDNPRASPSITSDEIDYLCESVNRYFSRKLRRSDVVWSFSGIRPLFEDAAKDATAVTRDYVLDVDASGEHAPLLSIFGGKITTYRKLAEQALSKLAKYFPATGNPWTASVPLPGGDLRLHGCSDFAVSLRRRFPFISDSLALRLARAYGTRAAGVLRHARSVEELGIHFGADLYQSEVDYLIATEWAQSADDIVLRRSKMVLHLNDAQIAKLAEYVDQRCGSTRRAVPVPSPATAGEG